MNQSIDQSTDSEPTPSDVVAKMDTKAKLDSLYSLINYLYYDTTGSVVNRLRAKYQAQKIIRELKEQIKEAI